MLQKRIGDYIDGDACPLETEPLARLAQEGQIKAFRHGGFWQCMDTFREMEMLNKIWRDGAPPWKKW